jgi:hypothetical protein
MADQGFERESESSRSERYLLALVDATEAQSAATGHGVDPWPYEQLAKAYRERKDHRAEVAILERFACHQHAARPHLHLLARLEKARALLGRGDASVER